MNSQGNANVFKQATTPLGWTDGDIWIKTSDFSLWVNNAGTAVQFGIGAIGNPLQVQRVNAAGTALEYADPVNDYELLGSATITGASAVQMAVTGLTTTAYERIIVKYQIPSLDAADEISLRVNNDSTASEYHTEYSVYPAAVSAADQTSAKIAVQGGSTAKIAGSVEITNDGTVHVGWGFASSQGGAEETVSHFQMATNTASIVSIQILSNGGVTKMAIGSRMFVYGVRNS